jgi:cytidylate kinase
MPPNPITIAIDGPAASGKSSTARAVAAALGYRHLDSGAFYRAVTLSLQRSGIPGDEWGSLDADRIAAFDIAGRPGDQGFLITIAGRDPGAAIRSPEVTAAVSHVAALAPVRAWLLGALREAGRGGGLVADGRDIGTVVFPGAELKVFLVCAPEERALRRLREQGTAEPDEAAIRAEARRLVERDSLDSQRAIAPLLRAADAIQLDTTALDFEAQVRAIVRLAEERIG